MKTAALFVSPGVDLLRVESRLLSLLTIGHWRIIIPDRPNPAECRIVQTCRELKRDFTTVGLNARSTCGAPGKHYRRLPLPRWWQGREWERDTWIIGIADMVICLGSPEIEERVPRIKQPAWFMPLVALPGSGDYADFHTANTRGLGALLVEKLRATA